MPSFRFCLSLMTLLGVAAAPAAAQHCSPDAQEFEPPDGEPGDSFGYRIERAGKLAVVAASFDDDLGHDSGSAYVHVHDGALGWRLEKKLRASDGAAWDVFGYAVAVDGDRVLVGAPGHDGAAADCGAVYVFARDHGGRGNWGEVASFAAPRALAGAGFGYALAVRGKVLLVGAPQHARGVPGRAYLYRRDAASASGWTLELDFTSADPATAFEFGQDVALGDGFLAVSGARTSVQPYADTYAVHVRERDAGGPGAWGEVQRLESPSETRDIFGYEISVDGDQLVAVAPAEVDFATFQAGALYLYRRDLGGPSRWGLERRLVASEADGFFAPDEVDLRGDWIVAGSSSAAVEGARGGAACVFGRHVGGPDAWGTLGRLADEHPEEDALYGLDLTLRGDELLIGAPGSYFGSTSGEVYVVDLGRVARASWRNDAARANPDVHRALSRPWLGTEYVAEVDLGATGHAVAVLVGYARRAETPLPGGRVLLGAGRLGSLTAAGPRARFVLKLPAEPSLCGRAITTQAKLAGGGRPFRLSNAQDLVLGFP